MPGDQLGPFVLVEKLGEGGMGVVYKARDTRLDRLVAIKLLPESRLEDPERRARFMQEARAASALNHPGIVTIHDIAEQDGRTYIVMELVDGKPLHERIPRKGMGLTEALRIAVQLADALAAAHAAGIVHRDLKPGNIMVDTQGRVKVLDFGLAKLTTPRPAGSSDDEETRTEAIGVPLTEAGTIVGSIPYMSPEQAEGRNLDARSDIFSFGAVLYEMVAGQRAFQGESRVSTLSAVVGRDPQPLSEVAPGVPIELERVIARCLRKDVSRRSQNMADVRLALEELRDESESGKLLRSTAAPAPLPARRAWLWPAVAVACASIALAASWTLLRRGPTAPPVAKLVRLSPDDGHSYSDAAISPDGKLVAMISDRSGTDQLWLQQIGGGEPIQLTHSASRVRGVQFFPDGTRLLVTRDDESDSKVWRIEIMPTLGGQPRLLVNARFTGCFSPDGRQVAYYFGDPASRETKLAVIPAEGGTPRVMEKWQRTQAPNTTYFSCSWLPDGQGLLVPGSKALDTGSTQYKWEWFALPIDGSDPVATGAGDALRAAGLSHAYPGLVAGGRVFFTGGPSDRRNVWQIPVNRRTRLVSGAPQQLTFGTENESPASVSATGMAAIASSRSSADFYLLPLDRATGHASGPVRRLTQDGRMKFLARSGGDPGKLFFAVRETDGAGRERFSQFALELSTSQQVSQLQQQSMSAAMGAVNSQDGRYLAYSEPDGDSLSIHVADASSLGSGRVLCGKCGDLSGFSFGGQYLFIYPGAPSNYDPKRKYTVALLDVASGKITPWLEDPTEAVSVAGLLPGGWVLLTTRLAGKLTGHFVVRWRTDAIPRSEWLEAHLPPAFDDAKFSETSPFVYGLQNKELMTSRFDPKQGRFGEPFAVRVPQKVEIEPYSNYWALRGPGIVYSQRQTSSSVWLMKLPE